MARDPDLPLDAPNSNESAQVALYGRDAVLLSYRNQVLAWAGFTTRTLALPLAATTTDLPARVAILCHTLTPEDRKAVMASLDQERFNTKVIALTSSASPLKDRLPYDALVESLAGPDVLIKAVRRLLDVPRSPGSTHPASI